MARRNRRREAATSACTAAAVFARQLALLMLASSLTRSVAVINEGDCICVEGIIMDQFCITRGRLLDNSGISTLEHPEEHSMHCLLDIGVCVDSGFTVLGDPDEPGALYTVAAKFDEDGTDLVFSFASDRGKPGPCYKCTGLLGNETKGFRAAVVGIVNEVGDLTSSDPLARAPSITVTNVLADGSCSNNYTCDTVQGDALVTNDPSSKPSIHPTTSNQPTISSAPSISNAPTPVPTPMSEEMLELLAAQTKWGQPASYEFVYQNSCFCHPSYIQPMYVVVENGIKTNVTYIEETLAGSVTQDVFDSVYTIEDQFLLIEEAIAGPYKADSVFMQYDEDWGYPQIVWIDYMYMISDEEFQIFNTVQLRDGVE